MFGHNRFLPRAVLISLGLIATACASQAQPTLSADVPPPSSTPFNSELSAMNARNLQILDAYKNQQSGNWKVPELAEACKGTGVIVWSITDYNPNGSPRSGGLILRERLPDNNEEYLFILSNHSTKGNDVGSQITIATKLDENSQPINGVNLTITSISGILGDGTNQIDASFVKARSSDQMILSDSIRALGINNLHGYVGSNPETVVVNHNPSFAGVPEIVVSGVDINSLKSMEFDLSDPSTAYPYQLEILGTIEETSPSVTKGSSSGEVCGVSSDDSDGFLLGVLSGPGEGILGSVLNFGFAPLPENIQEQAQNLVNQP